MLKNMYPKDEIGKFVRLGFAGIILLHNAKPSFEITKWMARHMLWQNTYQLIKWITHLHLSLQGCKKESFLRIFLYNAKPSFEIAKWMAKNMLWQNMKINKIMQKT